MNSLASIKAELEESRNTEYEALLPGSDPNLPVIIKVKTPGLQILVNKFGVNLLCRELGDFHWQHAKVYGFKRTYIRKNAAIAAARLRNNGLNNPDFNGTMFDTFVPESE